MTADRHHISFDLRRNLINVLGEDHYPYAEFLYHELAANSWDADATRVDITESNRVSPAPGRAASYDIEFADDGNGMGLDGLDGYFTVGQSSKVDQSSERLGRGLIGRIGVGKVAILKVARTWTIETERHPELDPDPVRLRVHVDVDAWISGDVAGFAIEELPATGRHGTTLLLRGVTARLREDRILRHLQRLPLGEDDFIVWRNGDLVPPRRWTGLRKLDVDLTARWEEAGELRSGPIRGEIWIRPEDGPRAYQEEPSNEKQGLTRDPAGIEVRVNRDAIVREFFGHASHGHSVTRLWGWVDANWLPILGNRTDYQRDHPAGRAFYDAVKVVFDEAYTQVRYENDARQKERKAAKAAKEQQDRDGAQGPSDGRSGGAGDADVPDGPDGDDGGGRPGSGTTAVGDRPLPEPPDDADQQLAKRFGETVRKVLEDKPEFAPVLDVPLRTGRGRPALDRIYPARPQGGTAPFVPDLYGDDLGVDEEDLPSRRRALRVGRFVRPGRPAPDGAVPTEPAVVTVNTRAGVQLSFARLGGLEGPYRWETDEPEQMQLCLNVDHPMYRAVGEPGGGPHRLHCAWLVAMAFAEQAAPAAARVADLVETLSYELYSGWGPLPKP